jgi:hypothetical protein
LLILEGEMTSKELAEKLDEAPYSRDMHVLKAPTPSAWAVKFWKRIKYFGYHAC